MYLIDLYVVHMPRDPFCPIILGRPFFVTTMAKIDRKKGVISLKFGEEKINFHFTQFKSQPYQNKIEMKEGTVIVELASIHFSTQKMNWREA
jgi:hypothetical protein